MTDWHVLTGGNDFSLFNFEPPGPVAEAYLYDVTTPIPLIMGPFGSGKTTTSIFKLFHNVSRVPPCRDGVTRARCCVIRDQYRALYRTTLESWFKFFPKDFPGSHFEGGQDRPAKHTIRFVTPRGRPFEVITDFYAVGDHAIEELLKGYEPTFGYANEADLLHDSVLPYLYGRLGRYPSRDMLADPDADMPEQVFGDLNPPDVDHWIYRKTQEERDPAYQLYKQPSGLSNEAENRRGVPRTRYENMARTLPADQVRRFVHGKFGYAVDGRPVHGEEFSEELHVSRDPLEPLDGLPLNLGLDGGLSPAAVIGQLQPNGQDRVLAELVPPHGTGPGRFAEMLVDLLQTRFRGCPIGVATCDPANFFGADREGGELAWVETVMRAIGKRIDPAPTNEPAIRIEAVRAGLVRMINAQTPATLIDPRCRMLIGGFVANYRYRRHRVGTRDQYSERPEKNDWSHPHDANQYRVLGLRGRVGVINEAARAGRAGNVVAPVFGRARSDFNVWDL